MTKNPDFKSYVSVQRWSSYWHQITEILDLQPATVLIIGCEDGIVGKFVGQYGINVSTFDLNPTLQPDYVGDVREIDKILNGKRFDVIVCCQVLEHIPYEHFEDILQKFSKLAKNVIISLPYAYSIYSITLNIPKLKLFNKRFSI
ncbi:MAG: class I SAM-dependent methyltransferase, partial [Paludibacter sp.]|nr:class I SAM-dependent methyltransferase [Paludibacter sp.]